MTVTDQQFNALAARVTQLQTYDLKHPGNPNGLIDAPLGATCKDTSSGAVYRKTTGIGDMSGWVTP
jgi:hypothetical protein